MASMQCHRSCTETCENKCHDNSSFGHKVTDMVGEVFKGNHQAHHNQSHCHGQTDAQHPTSQRQCFSQTQTHCVTNSNTHGHHGKHNSCSSNGMACHGKTHEKKMKNRCGGGEHKKKKDRSPCSINKHSDGNKSCSDSSSDSDSD